MSSFYFRVKDKTLIANNVDVERLARKIRKTLPDPNRNDSFGIEDAFLNIVARALGAQSYFDMRRQAEDPDISTWDVNDVQRFVQKHSATNGAKFPSKLPRTFDLNWQQLAQRLVNEAIKAREPGKLEFVALVGGSGTGKTLLANHVCANRGGKVIDVELSLQRGTRETYKPGSVLVYDRPAKPPSSNQPPMGTFALWQPDAPAKWTLKMYREMYREMYWRELQRSNKQSGIPHDDVFSSFTLRDWILDNPLVTFAVCFADSSQVKEALKSDILLLKDMKQMATINWRRAHLVNLDSMTFSSLDGPGLEMEQGKYVPSE